MHATVAVDPATPDELPEAPTGGEPAVDRPWRRALKGAIVCYLVSRVGLLAMTCFTWFGEANPGIHGPGAVFRIWTLQFDTRWFITIAAGGYPRNSTGAAHAAFFPLFPYVTRVVAPLFFFHYALAAMVVANLALVAALMVLYRLTEHEFGVDSAGRAAFYLVAFPTGFFLSTAYNEGTSIALTAAAIYAMRRGHWWWAGVAGMFAATARSAGILLVGAFLFEYVRQNRRRVRLDALAGLLIPAGLGVVMFADWYYYRDPLAFNHAQSRWGRQLTWPWKAIADTIVHVVDPGRTRPLFGITWAHDVLELGTVLLLLTMMVLMLVGPWKVRRDQFVLPLFGLALITFMVSFPSTFTNDIPNELVSTSRIGLEVFPGFMMLGRLGQSRLLDRLLLVVFLPLQGMLVAQFLHGWWVA